MQAAFGVSFLVLLLIVLFSNSIHNEFTFDDVYAIVGNDDATAKSSFESLWKNDYWGQDISEEGSHKSYRPLTILTFRLNSQFHYWMENQDWYKNFCTSTFNQNPLNPAETPILRTEFFHIINILIHLFVSILMGIFFQQICSKLEIENLDIFGYFPLWFISSILFIIHPVHVEAVTGLVGRAELLCTLFMLIGLSIWTNFLNSKNLNMKTKIFYYFICTLCFCCSVLSKETGFSLSVIFIVIQYIFTIKKQSDFINIKKIYSDKFLLFNIIYWASISIIYIIIRRYITVHMSILVNRQVNFK